MPEGEGESAAGKGAEARAGLGVRTGRGLSESEMQDARGEMQRAKIRKTERALQPTRQ
jgi:hypothetical protein